MGLNDWKGWFLTGAGAASCGPAPRPAPCRTAAVLCVLRGPWTKPLRQSQPGLPACAAGSWETDGLMKENTDQSCCFRGVYTAKVLKI